MKTVGIICEYNPFHLGHKKQFDRIRQSCGKDTAIVCLMSGNYVQRGAPAIFDKTLRARAAIDNGANLVLELPIPSALSSAEGFAMGGVKVLSEICDAISFGTESMDSQSLIRIAEMLLDPAFSALLRAELEKGCSFPAARANALQTLGASAKDLQLPNNILGIEYAKAILSSGSALELLPVFRNGDYHSLELDLQNPSATALRKRICESGDWEQAVPCAELFRNAPRHSLSAGERAILAKFRTMGEADFETVPFGSEGLWRKLMHASRSENTLEEIAAAVKSKRYTRTRIDRMILCAFLGITQEMMDAPVPYVRVLGFDSIGRSLLRNTALEYLNAGQREDGAYWELEQRCGNLYGLFSMDGIQPPDTEPSRRIYYKQGSQP